MIMPKKNSIFSPSAEIKICTLSKGLTTSSTHTHTHTHKTSENFMYGFVMGPLQFQTISQNTHLTSKTAIWLCWLSRKIDSYTHTQTNQNWFQFQKAQLIPYKTRYAFSFLTPGQGVMSTNLLPVIAPSTEIAFLTCICSIWFRAPPIKPSVCTNQYLLMDLKKWCSTACDTNHMICTRLVQKC